MDLECPANGLYFSPGRYVDLFAEEVVRGGPAFALSLVLSAVEPALRAAAELGAWQVISPVNALGRVAVVEGLHEVQDEVLSPRVDKFSVDP